MTDASIATKMVTDAFTNQFDTVILIMFATLVTIMCRWQIRACRRSH